MEQRPDHNTFLRATSETILTRVQERAHRTLSRTTVLALFLNLAVPGSGTFGRVIFESCLLLHIVQQRNRPVQSFHWASMIVQPRLLQNFQLPIASAWFQHL